MNDPKTCRACGQAVPSAAPEKPASRNRDKNEPPAYLGMHFILSPPQPEAVVSRVLQTVELVTLAIAGMYLAWWFRDKPEDRSR